MKKYINLLLFGFITFTFGLIIFNFEINKFSVVNYLPSNFPMTTDTFDIDLESNKEYIISKLKYNDNIIVEKVVNNDVSNKLIFEVQHSKTSTSYSSVKMLNDKVFITFYNDLFIDKGDTDIVFDMILKGLKEKKLYNYKLLKYSKIKVIGSEESLNKIEIK